MSGTAWIGRRAKFNPPKAAMARTPIITSQRCRMAKERMPSMIVCSSFRQLCLYDETVLCRVHIAFQHPECDFHRLRIALADLHVASLELLAVADKDDSAVLKGLQRRGLHRDRDRLGRQRHPAGDAKAGPPALPRIPPPRPGNRPP